MKLGIGSYTYPWAVGVPGHPPARPLGLADLLDRAVALGVRVIQVCDNLPLTALTGEELDQVEARLIRDGLELEIGTRGLDPANLRAHLDLATRVRAHFLRLVMDSPGDEPSPGEAVERLAPWAKEFRAAGVRLAVENHDRFAARVLAKMIRELGADWVGICLDTVNSFGALEGPEVVVPVLAPYALNLHVKDFTIRRVPSQMGFVVEGCPVGQGRLEIPWVLEQLRAAGRDVNAVVELWTPPGASLQETLARETAWAEASVRHLRTLIND